MKVGAVMTREVTTVAPGATLREVAETLVGGRISGLPVVDDSGAVLGVVSEGDIVGKEAGPGPEPSLLGRILHGTPPPSKLEARTAAEAMTSPAITVEENSEVAQAARLMTERGINRLPVVDEGGRLAGIVTRADLVRAFLRTDAEIERELREDVVTRTLWIDPKELQITVEGGEVALRGKVESKADAELLELFAARVPGVVGVHSTLRWRIDEPRVPESDPRVPAPPRHR